ncbi:MAG TPA: type VI secretion system baseplate subunit TssF [Polyangia bacterium]|nr:type VI secretion system baseplate subunit TssF [Polyangia bacterium]
MTERDVMYQRFLDQLHALEEFRRVHAELNPAAAVDRDDPAVGRIIEALAFFTARTQTCARDNLRASLDRVLGGYFDFLLSPMPSLATVEAAGAERLIEPLTLPEGCELHLGAPDGAVGRFRTLRETPLAPARLDGAEVLLRQDGFRLLVTLRALAPVRALDGPIALRIDHLDRLAASLRLHYNLRRHLQRVTAFFDRRPTTEDGGRPCEVALGAAGDGLLAALNPLERVRLLLHYPELELFAHVTLPEGHPPWTRLALAFDLDSRWPDSRAIAAAPLHLHALPVINLVSAPAAVIAADGLRSAYPIVPNELHGDTELRSVAGVFDLSPSGLQPLPSGMLPGADEGWQLERAVEPGGVRQRLRVRLRDAFAKPRRVVVQAEWHQPWFAARAVGPLDAWLPNRHAGGLKWRVLGGVRAACETPLDQMSSGLLELLALRMRPILRRDELLLLLQLLGAGEGGPFAGVLRRIAAVDVEAARDGGAADGARHRYRVRLEAVPPAEEALAWTLVARIRELCDAWSEGSVVAADVEVESAEPVSAPARARVAGART